MWSALRDLDGDGSEAMRGLERLATAYWRPLYVFLRKRGQDHDSAADGVQGFFEYLLSGELLRKARPGEGRFRNFLLVAFQRWLGDQRDTCAANSGVSRSRRTSSKATPKWRSRTQGRSDHEE